MINQNVEVWHNEAPEPSKGEWVDHYCQVERNWLIYCKTNIPACKHCGEKL